MMAADRLSPDQVAELRAEASRGGRAIDGGAAFTAVRDDVLLALVASAEREARLEAVAGAARVLAPYIDSDDNSILARAHLALVRALAALDAADKTGPRGETPSEAGVLPDTQEGRHGSQHCCSDPGDCGEDCR